MSSAATPGFFAGSSTSMVHQGCPETHPGALFTEHAITSTDDLGVSGSLNNVWRVINKDPPPREETTGSPAAALQYNTRDFFEPLTLAEEQCAMSGAGPQGSCREAPLLTLHERGCSNYVNLLYEFEPPQARAGVLEKEDKRPERRVDLGGQRDFERSDMFLEGRGLDPPPSLHLTAYAAPFYVSSGEYSHGTLADVLSEMSRQAHLLSHTQRGDGDPRAAHKGHMFYRAAAEVQTGRRG